VGRGVSEDWRGKGEDRGEGYLDTTRRFFIVLESGKVRLSKTARPHCNFLHGRKSLIGLTCACSSEYPRMCYENGGTSGPGTTLEVNIYP
jgi:hypothetical protein